MNRNFFLGIIIGVSVGAIAGLLYTPRPGMDTRRNIASRSRHARERLSGIAHSVRERVSGVEESIKQAI